MDIDRYDINGKYEQVFIGARELSTDDLPDQAQTWVNKNLRYTHGYGVAMSHVNEITKQGQPEYILKNIPSEGEIDRSEEHTSELQSRGHLVCRLLLEKKKK